MVGVYSIVTLSGCSWMLTDPHGVRFAELRDAEVGRQIDQTWYRFNPKRAIGNGKYEYTAQDKSSGCEVAYDVDGATMRILSWRYISDPSLCKADRYSGP